MSIRKRLIVANLPSLLALALCLLQPPNFARAEDDAADEWRELLSELFVAPDKLLSYGETWSKLKEMNELLQASAEGGPLEGEAKFWQDHVADLVSGLEDEPASDEHELYARMAKHYRNAAAIEEHVRSQPEVAALRDIPYFRHQNAILNDQMKHYRRQFEPNLLKSIGELDEKDMMAVYKIKKNAKFVKQMDRGTKENIIIRTAARMIRYLCRDRSSCKLLGLAKQSGTPKQFGAVYEETIRGPCQRLTAFANGDQDKHYLVTRLLDQHNLRESLSPRLRDWLDLFEVCRGLEQAATEVEQKAFD